MFKNAFLKLLLVGCIYFISVVCSYGQRVGIVDVVIQAQTAEVYELNLKIYEEVKISLIASDGTVYLEKIASDEVIIGKFPSGTYQLLINEEQIGRSESYFLRLED